ncbi:hypothetical protein ABIE78_006384 [Sinorhizobium fredii]|uniref:Uncharacterized protein n=1 Tax=Sinorhizobium fredii (strain USDA 257) TaxID=1185652 RepID=I3XDN3_SINF2|nr:hypothetical protein [Sinorhizobium fredii]AFL53989.1 hypothetical protein USDA257_c54740 [Sinorhizobium fredii USDA 257]
MSEALVRSICAEFEIEIIPANEFPKPGQTRAVATMRRILEKHGDGHLRLVVSTLAETEGNQWLIEECSLWISDLILVCSEWIDENASAWLELWDRLELGSIMLAADHLRGTTPVRHALAALIYSRLSSLAGYGLSNKDSGYGLRQRAGVTNSRNRRLELGRQLLKTRARPRPSQWKGYLQEAGLSYFRAVNAMRLAREADQQERSAA